MKNTVVCRAVGNSQYYITQDGGRVANDGYSLDGLEDAHWGRKYMNEQWSDFPHDIKLPNNFEGTPEDVLMHFIDGSEYDMNNPELAPHAWSEALHNMAENQDYKKYVPYFAKYLIKRGGLSKHKENMDVIGVRRSFEHGRDYVNQILNRIK